MSALLLLIRRSLRQHALSTTLTALSIALAGGLIMAVFAIRSQAEEAFMSDRLGFDGVLGARGSQLQLVLNAVFHLEVSPGNIPWTLYQDIKDHPAVDLAIPYALGDNYKGFRIIGTTSAIFDDLVFRDGGRFELEEGRFFDPTRREAVIGSFAAQQTRLSVGDVIRPYHGLTYSPGTQHEEEFIVVGVLKPTNSPADRVIWIPIEGIFRMEGHVLRGAGEVFHPEARAGIPDEHKEVSAVMLKMGAPVQGFGLANTINRQGTVATMAYPVGSLMADFFSRMGWMTRVLQLLAYAIVLVAVASNTAALYNTLNERRRDIAILRSLGARRSTIFNLFVLESSAIAAIGAAGAFAVYAVILAITSNILRQQTGVVLDLFAWHPTFWATPVGLVVLGALSGFLPAMKAYRTDVASNLAPIA